LQEPEAPEADAVAPARAILRENAIRAFKLDL